MLLYLRGAARLRGWIAWYEGRPLSAHADLGVLAGLMAAEGIGDAVRYTRAEDGVSEIPTYGDCAGAEPAEFALVGAAAPDEVLGGCGAA